MPEHITVYCRRRLEPGSLDRLVREPDYLTAAERAGLDEAAMETAIGSLVMTSSDAITYAGASRPIQVTHYADAEMVRTLVDEARTGIDGDDHGAIATLLGGVVEVVDVELGLDQAEGIGGVIAEQIALAVAFETDGIVEFYGNEWRAV